VKNRNTNKRKSSTKKGTVDQPFTTKVKKTKRTAARAQGSEGGCNTVFLRKQEKFGTEGGIVTQLNGVKTVNLQGISVRVEEGRNYLKYWEMM